MQTVTTRISSQGCQFLPGRLVNASRPQPRCKAEFEAAIEAAVQLGCRRTLRSIGNRHSQRHDGEKLGQTSVDLHPMNPESDGKDIRIHVFSLTCSRDRALPIRFGALSYTAPCLPDRVVRAAAKDLHGYLVELQDVGERSADLPRGYYRLASIHACDSISCSSSSAVSGPWGMS